jgi:hypothetical protein
MISEETTDITTRHTSSHSIHTSTNKVRRKQVHRRKQSKHSAGALGRGHTCECGMRREHRHACSVTKWGTGEAV